MKTILKIGYEEFVLSPKTNVNTLLEALSAAKRVYSRYHGDKRFYTPHQDGTNPEVSIVVVPDEQVLDGKRKLIPQTAGPDAHGEMV
ncbi:MAG TPA: hypothetical protein VHB20_07500 [Verrucomicrobiae bacterium]|jgi:hypothetical protein|nr:hypothetical protein [Verrucomicrobiae bacterium]